MIADHGCEPAKGTVSITKVDGVLFAAILAIGDKNLARSIASIQGYPTPVTASSGCRNPLGRFIRSTRNSTMHTAEVREWEVLLRLIGRKEIAKGTRGRLASFRAWTKVGADEPAGHASIWSGVFLNSRQVGGLGAGACYCPPQDGGVDVSRSHRWSAWRWPDPTVIRTTNRFCHLADPIHPCHTPLIDW